MTGADATRYAGSTDGSGGYDVAVVGGGPAGSSAAVFTARYGLDTVVLDRGNASLRRCAHLENYLGFPAGIDVETFYALAHDHVREAGAEVVADMVTEVRRPRQHSGSTGTPEFVVGTQEGRSLRARRVVAASTYDGEYLRGLDDDGAMFEVHDHHGETHEHFARDYADDEGRTPVEGLYVAGGLAGRGAQAIVAAGHGARVARTLVADASREAGSWDEAAEHWDWLRRRAALDHDWDDREAWNRRFDDHRRPVGEDVDRDRYERIRDHEIAWVQSTYLDRDEIDRRARRGRRRLAAHLDDEALLDAVDDDLILDRARELAATTEAAGGEEP